MAFRKHVLISVVLLAISGILFGCGDSTVAPTTTTDAPIVAPSNVTAEALPNGDILIRWDASTQPNLKGYNVYRLNTRESAIEKMNHAVLAQNRYLDDGAHWGVEYEYRVTAVSNKDVESGFTAVLITSIPDNGTNKDQRHYDN